MNLIRLPILSHFLAAAIGYLIAALLHSPVQETPRQRIHASDSGRPPTILDSNSTSSDTGAQENTSSEAKPQFSLESDEVVVSRAILDHLQMDIFAGAERLIFISTGATQIFNLQPQEKKQLCKAFSKFMEQVCQCEVDSLQVIQNDAETGVSFKTQIYQVSADRIVAEMNKEITEILGSKRGRDMALLCKNQLLSIMEPDRMKAVSITPIGDSFEMIVDKGKGKEVYNNLSDVPFRWRHLARIEY